MIDVAMNMESIYHCMVNKENYRMLANFQYTHQETPLRSARLGEAPPMTDVSVIFTEHFIYINKIIINIKKLKQFFHRLSLMFQNQEVDRTQTKVLPNQWRST